MSKEMLRRIVKAVCLLFFPVCLLAQQTDPLIEFTYDAAGNRTQRKYIAIACKTDGTDSVKTDSIKQKEPVTTQLGDGQVKIFPNPTTGILKVEFSGSISGERRMEVYDVTGKLLKQKKIQGDSETVDFSGYACGNYFLKIRCDNLESEWKIVKTD